MRIAAATAVAILACLLAGAVPAGAGIPTDLWAFDDSLVDFHGEDYEEWIPGEAWRGEGVGMATAAGCDVTGDGVDDVIAGAPWAKVDDVADTGHVYVIPGGEREAGEYDLSSASAENPPAGAIALRADTPEPSVAGQAGAAVACAGDVNGDGTGDVLVGQGETAAPAYVVFGGDLPAGGLDLATIGADDRGFAIADSSYTLLVGRTVAGVGDVDGDGKDDIALGDQWAETAVVVSGRDGGDPVDLASEAPRMKFVTGPGGVFHSVGTTVAAAGDVDGDEVPDLLVGQHWKDGTNGTGTGAAYVVSGAATGTVDVEDPGADVLLKIEGPRAGAGIGRSLSAAGDANGDGLADVAIGTAGRTEPGNAYLSDAWVVYGRAGGGVVDLGAVDADDGYTVSSRPQPNFSDGLGTALASAGDIDGDGRDDLVLGAPRSEAPGVGASAGAAYLVFGRADGEPVDLATVSCGESAAMIGDSRLGGLGASVAATTGFGGGGDSEIVVGANAGGSGTSGNLIRSIPVSDVSGECELPPTEPVTFGSGQLEWGLKETFRNYIVGPIAQGSYEAFDGATKLSEPNGVVHFDVLGGDYDPVDGSGELVVDGTVAFRGHHGQLGLVLRNLRVVLDGVSGTLFGDLTSRSLADGQDRAYPGIALATLTVPAVSGIAGGAAFGPLATTLTAEAAPAFELYTPGTALDPISVDALYGTPRERPDRRGPVLPPPGGRGDTPPQTKPKPKPASKAPALVGRRSAVRVGRGGRASIGTLRCGSVACKVVVPKSVTIRVARKSHRLAVLAPRTLAVGKRGTIRVKVPKAVRAALVGRRATVKVKVSLVAGGRRTTRTLRAVLKGAKPAGARSRPAVRVP